MRSPFRLWLAERAELIALGVTLVATASLVFWWTILLRGEMRNNEVLERALLAREQELTAQQVAEREIAIAAHHDRRNVMLVGESTLLALMLSGSLVVLFLLAQRRKQQREDMEKLLQFTSHEFKTPVAGVKGLLQSLALGSIPEAQRAELIQLGQIECDRLEHLAETILAYQRAMSREPRAGAQRFDAAQFIGDLLAHRASTSTGGKVEVASIDSVHVMGDRDGLRTLPPTNMAAAACASRRKSAMGSGASTSATMAAALSPPPRKNCLTCTTGAVAMALRMERAWGWRSRGNWRAAWAATWLRTARDQARELCSR